MNTPIVNPSTMNNPKSNLDHTEIPIWNSENWLYEDFEVGKRARSIRRTISEGESMMFNALVLDMHPYVADEVFAKEEGSARFQAQPSNLEETILRMHTQGPRGLAHVCGFCVCSGS